MKRRIKQRLRSQNGETIGEVLIALLVSAIALTMLAQMIGSATGMITRSEKNMEEYYEAVNPLSDRDSAKEDGTVSFSCENMKPFEELTVKCIVPEKEMGDSELITFYFVKDKSGDTP